MNIERLKLGKKVVPNLKLLSNSGLVTIGKLIDSGEFGLNISAEEAADLSMIRAPHTLINSESEQIWPKKRKLKKPFPSYPCAG